MPAPDRSATPDPMPAPMPLSDDVLARAHRRIGEHLHEVEEQLLDVADAVDGSGLDGPSTRQRARAMSADADRQLARADELDGRPTTDPGP
ncbi:hypothetical protein [Geodermatophilus sp. URMC 64]